MFKTIKRVLILAVIIFAASTKPSLAIPPPDFLFSAASQLIQAFSLLVGFFSLVIGTLYQTFKAHYEIFPYKKILWAVAIVVVIASSLGGAYLYDTYVQNSLYQNWLKESLQYNKGTNELKQEDNLDKLKDSRNFPISDDVVDKNTEFIKTYYSNIAKGKLNEAYQVSAKTVPFGIYKTWYQDVTDAKLEAIQKIDFQTYSFGVTLIEHTTSTRFAVLMRLATDGQGVIRIQSAQTRLLSLGTISDVPGDVSTDTTFFEAHKYEPPYVTNSNFQIVLAKTSNLFILDAREDEEYSIGRFPGSKHIRFADIKAGAWVGLPTDKVIYVFCWSGIRGKEVVDFLRSKKIFAQYIEKGASDWVAFGGKWEGEIHFYDHYSANQYRIILTLDEVKSHMQQGVVVVDSRIQAKYTKWHIPGSINIPIIYTPTGKMNDVLDQVHAGTDVITICDDFVSCFDANITGMKLEKKGHIFLGRYNKPWEYRYSK